MKTTSVSLLKQNLSKCINEVIQKDDMLLVSSERGNAIILSETNYLSMLDVIYHESQRRMIKDGENEDLSSMSTYITNEEW